MFCPKCGRNVDENICPYCHEEVYKTANDSDINKTSEEDIYNEINNYIGYNESIVIDENCKSRLMAGILQIFLGAFGIGRFYLGYYKIAFCQIALSVCTVFIGGTIWGLIDGIRILRGKPVKDAMGNYIVSGDIIN